MDVLDRRRRAVRPEDSTALQQGDREYETALGQEGSMVGQVSTPTSPVATGSGNPIGARAAQALASPGALEMGLGGPKASPFHSDKIKDEVELMRKRPLCLDADAQP